MSNYGEGDATYQAAGEYEGITKLVDYFYVHMSTRPDSKKIRDMHPKDIEVSADKLRKFLSGWMGGPRLLAVAIPMVHRHFDIGEEERDQWLICMKLALDDMDYPEDFKLYLMHHFSFPAEKIRQVCAARMSSHS